jgi:CheY-like chemotaxis protein
MRILEDDDPSGTLSCARWATAGSTIVEIDTAREAIKLLHGRGAFDRPIADIKMPGLQLRGSRTDQRSSTPATCRAVSWVRRSRRFSASRSAAMRCSSGKKGLAVLG